MNIRSILSTEKLLLLPFYGTWSHLCHKVPSRFKSSKPSILYPKVLPQLSFVRAYCGMEVPNGKSESVQRSLNLLGRLVLQCYQ